MDGICYTLQWAAPFPLKIAHSRGGSGPPSNSWFLVPTQVLNAKGMSIDSSTFCRARDYDRQTDHTTLTVTIGCIYVRNTTMRPKNGYRHNSENPRQT